MTSTGSLSTSAMVAGSEARLLSGSIEPAGSAAAQQSAQVRDVSTQGIPLAPRNAGDEVNRFLLCALIRESSKHIKIAADRSGIYLPVTRIVRRLLACYGQAARENPGLLTGPSFNTPILRSLNEKLCKDELGRYSQQIVSNSETLLAHARRAGDQTRIKAAEEALEIAVSARNRMAEIE